MKNSAILNKEFFNLLESKYTFEENPHFGLCVSGGPDSLALMILMKNFVKKKGGRITVFHFNHNLRKKSLSESEFVRHICTSFKLRCIVINWNEKKPKSGIMSKAREIRYKQIIFHCKKLKILHLMTAHHYDDVLETFMMRSLRKFSSVGLSSIPHKRIDDSLQIIRPLISFEKKRLVDTCRSNKLTWINDPSNFDPFFERVRVRSKIGELNCGGKKKLIKGFLKSKKNNIQLEDKVSNFFAKNITFYEYGAFSIEKKKFLDFLLMLKLKFLKRF